VVSNQKDGRVVVLLPPLAGFLNQCVRWLVELSGEASVEE
jgi:hypothetical protein